MTFHDFWTNENNPALPKEEYLYGARHIIVLVLTVLLCIILTLIFYKKSDKVKRNLFYCLGAILLFFEILSRVVNLIIEPNLNLENVVKILLPMHICSVMVWVFIFAIYSKNKMLLNFGVIGGLLATVAFLLYPAVGLNRVYMSFTCIYSTFSHMLGFVTCVLMLTLGLAEFEFKKMWQTYLCFVVMFAWGALLNFVIFPGSDYMYMVNDPLELNLNFPYQILYALLLVVYIFIFYLIYYFKQKLNNRRITKLVYQNITK